MNEQSGVVICFDCRRRISPAELISGRHDHADASEDMAYDLAVNDGRD